MDTKSFPFPVDPALTEGHVPAGSLLLYDPNATSWVKRPKVITICGSSRFVTVMAVCGWLLERDENAAVMGLHLLPGWYTDARDHLAEHEGVSRKMDDLHLLKISMSDEIFVVNVDHYIGSSTEKEVEHAKRLGKPIRWFSQDPVGVTVRELMADAIAEALSQTELIQGIEDITQQVLTGGDYAERLDRIYKLIQVSRPR